MTCVSVKMFCLLNAVFITANCQPNITTSSENLCLGDSVQLNCSAQDSAIWTSDDILGPDQCISFSSGDNGDPIQTVGNGTGVLLETSPHIVTSLSFNLTTDRVETNCTDSQHRTTTTISSVQPSPNGDYPVMVSGGSITWGPPSNIDDFLLQNYQLTIECNGTVVDGVNTTEATYNYDEGKLIPGQCSATVGVINSCGDTASNSTLFTFKDTTEDNGGSNSGLAIGLGVGLGVGIPVLAIIVLVIVLYKRYKKNETKGPDNSTGKNKGAPGFPNSVPMK